MGVSVDLSAKQGPSTMPQLFRNVLKLAFFAAWTVTVAIGIAKLWSYEGIAGAAAHPPLVLTADSPIAHTSNLPELILLVHPHCPCSRATIGELAKLMARCDGKLHATVLMVRPVGVPSGWEKTDLWSSAAAIPGVTVISDEEGRQSNRFGAATSGQTLLYSASGRLMFAGGITESRGHSGDNAGESAIISLVLNTNAFPGAQLLTTPVYGCALFNESPTYQKEGCTVCRK
jgi:hypothetical protein